MATEAELAAAVGGAEERSFVVVVHGVAAGALEGLRTAAGLEERETVGNGGGFHLASSDCTEAGGVGDVEVDRVIVHEVGVEVGVTGNLVGNYTTTDNGRTGPAWSLVHDFAAKCCVTIVTAHAEEGDTVGGEAGGPAVVVDHGGGRVEREARACRIAAVPQRNVNCGVVRGMAEYTDLVGGAGRINPTAAAQVMLGADDGTCGCSCGSSDNCSHSHE